MPPLAWIALFFAGGACLGLSRPLDLLALSSALLVPLALVAAPNRRLPRAALLALSFVAGAWSVPASPRVFEAPAALWEATVRSLPSPRPWGETLDADTGNVRIRIATDGPSGLAPGDRVAFRAALEEPHGFANPGGRLREERLRRDGIQSTARVRRGTYTRIALGDGLLARLERVRSLVRAHVQRHFEEPARGVVRALVLGEGSAVPQDTRLAFQGTGTSHILAVSGLHVVIVCFLLYRMIRRVLLHATSLGRSMDVARVAAAATVPCLVLYVAFAGAGPSAVRAGVMLGTVLLARIVDRPRAAPAALAAAAIAQIAVDPSCVLRAGWQLSYVSVLSLLTLAPAIDRRLSGWRPTAERTGIAARSLRWLRRMTAANFAICAATAPLLAHHFGLATPGALVANFLAVPATSFALLPASLLWAVGALLRAEVAAPLASAISVMARAMVDVLGAIAVLPGSSFEIASPGLLAAAALSLGLVAMPVLKKRARVAAIAVCLGAILPTVAAEAAPTLRTGMRITFLDVGQGDAALVELPRGRAVLVDAGGLPASAIDIGALEVVPLLRRRRIRALDALVLSHPHPDHYGGLPAVVARFGSRAVWDSGQGEAEGLDDDHSSLLDSARRAGARLLYPRTLCGRPYAIAGARLELLGPCPHHDPGWGPNDNSLVVRISFGAVRVLLPGDLERTGESWLLGEERLAADVVKVPHHGSRTSSTDAFVRGTGAHVAVVSVGRRNRLGHPAPEVVARWEAAGATVLRTDRDGAVVLETDGRTARVTSVRHPATGRSTGR